MKINIRNKSSIFIILIITILFVSLSLTRTKKNIKYKRVTVLNQIKSKSKTYAKAINMSSNMNKINVFGQIMFDENKSKRNSKKFSKPFKNFKNNILKCHLTPECYERAYHLNYYVKKFPIIKDERKVASLIKQNISLCKIPKILIIFSEMLSKYTGFIESSKIINEQAVSYNDIKNIENNSLMIKEFMFSENKKKELIPITGKFSKNYMLKKDIFNKALTSKLYVTSGITSFYEGDNYMIFNKNIKDYINVFITVNCKRNETKSRKDSGKNKEIIKQGCYGFKVNDFVVLYPGIKFKRTYINRAENKVELESYDEDILEEFQYM